MSIEAKKIVVALGGNAILSDDATDTAQKAALLATAKQLVILIKKGYKLIVTHGNGPQVGNLLLQQAQADSKENPAMPLDTCVAMTEGSIGYWLQQALVNCLAEEQMAVQVACLLTQVIVSENDPAFTNPTKPVGPFLTKDVAQKNQAATGEHYREDSGRGWRKVVPSPKPLSIKEYPIIKMLMEQGIVTISVGGGGIPTVEKNNQLQGIEAVIDKDYASQKLASLIDADTLIVLTGVDHVFINYQKSNQKKLTQVTVTELEMYIKEEQFAKGSMLPKVEAAIEFVSEKVGRQAIITSLDNLPQLFTEAGGTVISN